MSKCFLQKLTKALVLLKATKISKTKFLTFFFVEIAQTYDDRSDDFWLTILKEIKEHMKRNTWKIIPKFKVSDYATVHCLQIVLAT